MTPAVAEVKILTERELMGPAWAEKRPARADDLWVAVFVNGRRKRQKIGRPTERNQEKARELQADWQVALDRELGLVNLPVPTFRTAGQAYIESGLRSHAPKTVRGRTYQVRALTAYYGDKPLDRIDAPLVVQWWADEIEGQRDWRTGSSYLDVTALVFKHAQRRSARLVNPVPAAREVIFGDIRQTKAYRGRNQANLNPVPVEHIRKLWPRLEREPADFWVAVLLLAECGLRFGEMKALRWEDVWLGRDADDTTRHVHVRLSETDGREGGPKTGMHRKVALSRRLRAVLQEWRVASGSPPARSRVVDSTWGNNFRARLSRCCRDAKVPVYSPKDFRDTFASVLITHGIVLKWVSLQLGHARVATTENHYAAYMALEGYENPWIVPQGCLPVDLFAERDLWRPALRQHHANLRQHSAGKRAVTEG